MWRCRYCETYNDDDANFCMICGSGKNAAPAPEVSSDEPTFKAPERPAPAPRPRPSNMWDNGDGLGGATDIKALAAKRAAEKAEREARDEAIRRKYSGSKEGRDISDSFERHVDASRAAAAAEAESRKKTTIIIVIVMIVLLIAGLYYAKEYMSNDVPPIGAPISLTESSVIFRAGPGYDYTRYGSIDADDSFRYLGEIEEDSHGTKWCKVSHNGLIGYIRYDYVEFE